MAKEEKARTRNEARLERVEAALVKYRGMKKKAKGAEAKELETRIAALADERELLKALG